MDRSRLKDILNSLDSSKSDLQEFVEPIGDAARKKIDQIAPYINVPVENNRRILFSDLKGKELENFRGRIDLR